MIIAIGLLLVGCVSTGTHKQILAELEESRKAAAQTTSAFEKYKQQASGDIEALQKEKSRLSNELLAAQGMATKAQQALESASKKLADTLEPQRELEQRVKKLQDDNEMLQQLSGELRRERDQELGRLRQELSQLHGTLQQQEQRLKTEEAEKARLERERAAKDAEIQRLTRTHAELSKALESEIAKGDIRIQQVRDRLTINMVDRVLFDSGQSQVKPAGLKVLKQVSDILKKVTDKQIRIEGHTDNVPIGVRLRERFPTNWELSTARATSVVRLLIEEGDVDRVNLSAAGYADTRPVASNDTEDGRTINRRIEIVLYPKDLSEIAGQMKP